MNSRFFFPALLSVILLGGCHHIDDSKYEQVYFNKVSEKLVVTPTPVKEEKQPPQQEKKIISHQAGVLEQEKEAPVERKDKAIKKDLKIKKEEKKAVPAQSVPIKASPAPAAKKEEPVKAKKKRKLYIDELTVKSDSMNFNKDTDVAVFKNNVILKSQGVTVYSNRLKTKNYKESAEATGNVRAYYTEYDMSITCRRMVYGNGMKNIDAYDRVVAKKVLPNGNTLTMYSDEAGFDLEGGIITAKKKKRRVKVVLKDMVAFSDSVLYNEEKEELELTGKPLIKKQKSLFLSEVIKIDVDKKAMKLSGDIWSKMYYEDFEKAREEYADEKAEN